MKLNLSEQQTNRQQPNPNPTPVVPCSTPEWLHESAIFPSSAGPPVTRGRSCNNEQRPRGLWLQRSIKDSTVQYSISYTTSIKAFEHFYGTYPSCDLSFPASLRLNRAPSLTTPSPTVPYRTTLQSITNAPSPRPPAPRRLAVIKRDSRFQHVASQCPALPSSEGPPFRNWKP